MEQPADTTTTAFGLDIGSAAPLSFLSSASATPTGRALSLSVHLDEAARGQWPKDGSSLICDEISPDGSVNFRIESHPDAGYLIAGPEYGAHLLSPDGRRLSCFPEGQPEGAWQRLLVAQALPFAALLHGLEVFHASAVVRERQAVAFLGPSRSGKTSLALALCARGASFLADDVLALETRAGKLFANPGSPLAGVAREQRSDGADDGLSREQVVAENVRERMVRIEGAAEAVPLGTLFFVDRRADGPESPTFESTTDAQLLLAATFNFVLATPERLQRLLEVCALAARLRVETVTAGPATSAPELADAIERRLSSPP
ncbi:MAG TPA: hypothetical protein VFY36_03520 [Solirubrobacteraceae bacterium]|nr:hypothetical protein [Solirubrobacteraceae bacterium]